MKIIRLSREEAISLMEVYSLPRAEKYIRKLMMTPFSFDPFEDWEANEVRLDEIMDNVEHA